MCVKLGWMGVAANVAACSGGIELGLVNGGRGVNARSNEKARVPPVARLLHFDKP